MCVCTTEAHSGQIGLCALVKLLKNDLPSMEIQGRVSPAVSVAFTQARLVEKTVKAISRNASPAILTACYSTSKTTTFLLP